MAPGPKRFDERDELQHRRSVRFFCAAEDFTSTIGASPVIVDRFLQAADFELGVDRDRLTELEPTLPGSPCLKP